MEMIDPGATDRMRRSRHSLPLVRQDVAKPTPANKPAPREACSCGSGRSLIELPLPQAWATRTYKLDCARCRLERIRRPRAAMLRRPCCLGKTYCARSAYIPPRSSRLAAGLQRAISTISPYRIAAGRGQQCPATSLVFRFGGPGQPVRPVLRPAAIYCSLLLDLSVFPESLVQSFAM